MKSTINKLYKQLLNTKADYFILERLKLLLDSGFSRQQVAQILDLADLENHPTLVYWKKRYPSLFELLSLRDCCAFIYNFQLFKHEISQIIVKTLFYPLTLILAGNFVLIFFRRYFLLQLDLGLPQIAQEVLFYQNLLKTIMNLQVVVLLLFLFILLILRQPIIRNMLYQLFYRKKLFLIVVDYFTLRFMVIFNHLSALGLTTALTLKIMTKLKNERIICHLAYDFQQQLEQGAFILKAIQTLNISQMMKEVFVIACHSPSKQQILEDYLHVFHTDYLKSLAKTAAMFQYVSYVFIGMIIVLLYQIISLPLQAINYY